jgi:hypothetical protein
VVEYNKDIKLLHDLVLGAKTHERIRYRNGLLKPRQ